MPPPGPAPYIARWCPALGARERGTAALLARPGALPPGRPPRPWVPLAAVPREGPSGGVRPPRCGRGAAAGLAAPRPKHGGGRVGRCPSALKTGGSESCGGARSRRLSVRSRGCVGHPLPSEGARTTGGKKTPAVDGVTIPNPGLFGSLSRGVPSPRPLAPPAPASVPRAGPVPAAPKTRERFPVRGASESLLLASPGPCPQHAALVPAPAEGRPLSQRLCAFPTHGSRWQHWLRCRRNRPTRWAGGALEKWGRDTSCEAVGKIGMDVSRAPQALLK
ncbi:basic proline-rich protein-like [Prinia subflava]|uniref:basic proline-rich protein-like n=1 Tax=Prinia subflava TaxID=208062 RepID=UPI002FDFF8E6